MTAIPKSLVAVGCTTALVTGVAACGTIENISAGKKLENAADKLGERRSLSMELDLDATPEQLIALSKSDSAAEPMTREEAEALAGMKVSVAVQAKKPLAEAKDKDLIATRVKLSGPDGDLVEYRIMGETAYMRVDMRAFGELSGEPIPSADELPADMPGGKVVRKLFDGGWVKLDTAEMDKAREEMGAGAGKKGADGSEVSPETSRKIAKSLKKLFAREVTLKDKGRRDGADHVVATGPVRTLLTGVFNELRPFTDELPGGEDLPTAKDFKDVPNEKIAVDFAIKNGALAEASADLAPLAEGLKKGDKLPLKLTFGEGGKITAPSGATELDIKELMEAAGAMMLGGVDGADDAVSGDDFIVDDDVQGPEDINGIDGLTIDLDDLDKADARNR
ncbi:hypothetical protein SBI_06149 [Streptomyces bingchenggensis BCW-1]|uniref:Lipoprotein n=1 Tax=Streptomyces bingchenggensis (strain BCW-1) TaxID=749414 RepID=D7BQQ2_STRBB|nr:MULTISPECIES: hypothetical protein [Streptomyces]ADI09269.1 hypothetical protein SBI_06149 [Streptomyces bingchenggensis BCW-1]